MQVDDRGPILSAAFSPEAGPGNSSRNRGQPRGSLRGVALYFVAPPEIERCAGIASQSFGRDVSIKRRQGVALFVLRLLKRGVLGQNPSLTEVQPGEQLLVLNERVQIIAKLCESDPAAAARDGPARSRRLLGALKSVHPRRIRSSRTISPQPMAPASNCTIIVSTAHCINSEEVLSMFCHADQPFTLEGTRL
jgi:hypothetical protein